MKKENSARGDRLIKNSVLNLVNQTIALVASFATSVIVARILKPENYGIFNMTLWLSGLFSWIISLGLIQAVTKYVAEYRGKKQDANVNTVVLFVMKIEIGVSILFTALLVFFSTPIADYFFSENESFYFALAFMGLLPGILTAVFSATIDGLQKFEYFTKYTIITTPIAFAAKIGALYAGYKINGLLAVNLLFSVVNTLFFWHVLKKEGIRLFAGINPEEGTVRKKIISYNWTVSAIQLTAKVVWDKSENFFLGRYCSAVQLGYYNLAFNVAQRFMTLLPSTFWRVLFPAMSEYFGSGDKEKISRLFYLSSRYIAFVSFPVGIAGIVLSYPIINYMYGAEYLGSKYALQIFFFSMMITSLSKPGSAILYGMEKQSFILKYSAVLAVVNIALSLLLIPKYGALGAAVSYSIVTMAGSVGGLIYTCSRVSLIYPFKSIFKIMMSSIIMGIVMTMIVKQEAELLGFILSIPAGIAVYFISSTLWGTFEEEDYTLLKSLKKIFPGKWGKYVDDTVSFVASFKDGTRK
ncbi:MAG: flippase [Fibrobacteres bacterium]|nr:flippase [Fibrobacterota bacterium]